jgi:hypothetical protein
MARRVGFWIAWYVPLAILWLAFVGTLAGAEVVAGLVAAAIAATAAELVRSQELVRFRLDPRWLRGLHQLPWQVLGDCWLLTVACGATAPAVRCGGRSGSCHSPARTTTAARRPGGRWSPS